MDKRKLAAGVACGVACSLAAAVPSVSNIVAGQDSASRLVTVTYALADAPAIVTAEFVTNGVSVEACAYSTLSGDVNKVLTENGDYSFTWDPAVDWPGQEVSGLGVKLTPWTTNAPPPYMVVALKPYASVTSYEISYYPAVVSLPWGGVTNSAARERFLVLKRINAAGQTFQMGAVSGDPGRNNSAGSGSHDGPERIHDVTLANDFYLGVFEVTVGQWSLVTGSQNPGGQFTSCFSDKAGRPREKVSFCHIRECDSTLANATTNTASMYPNPPHGSSFLGKLQARTGNLPFDLPSEAQWEYACRGGHYGKATWGDGSSRSTGVNMDANLCNLARYKQNDGYLDGTTEPATSVGATNGTAIVGSYKPNSYGLYDMHGNVFEFCLDWWADDITGLNGAVNADGANLADGTTAGTYRVIRGGSWAGTPQPCLASSRSTSSVSPASFNKMWGFRVAMPLPAPDGAAAPVAVTATIATLDSRVETVRDLVIPDFSTYEAGTIIVIR